ncbi:MAG: pyridoxamine 5'-phosphate oxidase family protein [Spirochaetaceae bacterium]|jgi:nitroimidazol reductase NimA-like FMN-containing flavoprotein (pyridoxamine 5'-phosphate oxidase superfamily)|nr:pyridoxamine 5'-phosphate oxidase family protein [Spirochaetaceae bacterium]
MFKEMRRKDRELTRGDAMAILQKGKFGVMALAGSDGYPYGVPLHYALIDGDVYFHSSAEGGHKTECFDHNPKASFTVIETKNGVKARSAIIFEMVEMVPDMRITVLEKLIEKFVPKFVWKQVKAGVPPAQNAIIAYRLKAEHITAKFIDRPKKQK